MSFGSDRSLTVLLTTESLLFAVFALTLSFGSSTLGRVSLAGVARVVAIAAAAVLTVLGGGAAIAWFDVFVNGRWPNEFAAWFPAAAIALGAVCQPIFAWVFAINLVRK